MNPFRVEELAARLKTARTISVNLNVILRPLRLKSNRFQLHSYQQAKRYVSHFFQLRLHGLRARNGGLRRTGTLKLSGMGSPSGHHNWFALLRGNLSSYQKLLMLNRVYN